MKKLELNPSDYTNDDIYTAFEHLNSQINDEYFEKLEALNKMYNLIQKNLSTLGLPLSSFFSKKDAFFLQWHPAIKKLRVKDSENQFWDLSCAPKKYRLAVEKILPEAIKLFAEHIGQIQSEEERVFHL